MKSATVTLGIFTALTSAYSHPRHMHFRRQNLTEPAASTLSVLPESAGYATINPTVTAPSGTGAVETSAPFLEVNSTSSLLPLNGTSTKAGGAITTLTVIATSVETITSCAATITNCPTKSEDLANLPSEALSTVLVTQTKVITEVTCPVSEASSIESSILASASSTPPVLAVTTTSEALAATTSHVLSTETVTLTHVATITSSKVVTITLGGGGAGGKPHVVTTTIKTQVESTVEEVVTTTVSHDAVGVPTKNAETDSTTTQTTTTTGTRTVTVPGVATYTATPGGGGFGDNSNGGSGSGNGGGLGEDSNNAVCTCPPAAAAVTVTHTAIAPASTVYVTVKETVSAPPVEHVTKTREGGKGGKGKGNTAKPTHAATTTTGADAVETSESACPPDEVVTVTESESATASETGVESVAPTLAPFPASNSSSIAPTGGVVPTTSLSYH